jgi:hypothetical protein
MLWLFEGFCLQYCFVERCIHWCFPYFNQSRIKLSHCCSCDCRYAISVWFRHSTVFVMCWVIQTNEQMLLCFYKCSSVMRPQSPCCMQPKYLPTTFLLLIVPTTKRNAYNIVATVHRYDITCWCPWWHEQIFLCQICQKYV